MLNKLKQWLKPAPAQKAQEFWTWFVANKDVYEHIGSQPEEERNHSISVLLDHLAKYDHELVPLVGSAEDPQYKAELIISADGKSERFSSADFLVAHAPQVDNWHFIALKPALPPPHIVEIEHVQLDASTLSFAVLSLPQEPDSLFIRVFLPAYPAAQHDLYATAAFLLVEQMLGERTVGTHIRYLEFAPLSSEVPQEALSPLPKLPNYLAQLTSH